MLLLFLFVLALCLLFLFSACLPAVVDLVRVHWFVFFSHFFDSSCQRSVFVNIQVLTMCFFQDQCVSLLVFIVSCISESIVTSNAKK